MKAAIYARVSTAEQSPESQLRDLRQYAKARGMVITEYADTGFSGAKQSRPDLDRLMDDARKRQFDCVLVWRFDRLARNTKHLLLAPEEFGCLAFSSSAFRRTSIQPTRLDKLCSRLSRPLPSWNRISSEKESRRVCAMQELKASNWADLAASLTKTRCFGSGRRVPAFTDDGIVVAATANDPTALDPAILRRPGRFDRVVAFPNPTAELRVQFFHKLNPSLAESDLQRAAAESGNFSFALLREAYVLAGQYAYEAGSDIGPAELVKAIAELRQSMKMSGRTSSEVGFGTTQRNPTLPEVINDSTQEVGECS